MTLSRAARPIRSPCKPNGRKIKPSPPQIKRRRGDRRLRPVAAATGAASPSHGGDNRCSASPVSAAQTMMEKQDQKQKRLPKQVKQRCRRVQVGRAVSRPIKTGSQARAASHTSCQQAEAPASSHASSQHVGAPAVGQARTCREACRGSARGTRRCSRARGARLRQTRTSRTSTGRRACGAPTTRRRQRPRCGRKTCPSKWQWTRPRAGGAPARPRPRPRGTRQ